MDMDQESFCLGATLDVVSQPGRSPWLGSVVGIIWQRSGITLAMDSGSGVSQSVCWSSGLSQMVWQSSG